MQLLTSHDKRRCNLTLTLGDRLSRIEITEDSLRFKTIKFTKNWVLFSILSIKGTVMQII